MHRVRVIVRVIVRVRVSTCKLETLIKKYISCKQDGFTGSGRWESHINVGRFDGLSATFSGDF